MEHAIPPTLANVIAALGYTPVNKAGDTGISALGATSLALGGATIGANALAVTGQTTLIPGSTNSIILGRNPSFPTVAAFSMNGDLSDAGLSGLFTEPGGIIYLQGTGHVRVRNSSTIVADFAGSNATLLGALAIPAAGSTGTGLFMSSTTNFGIMFGSGAPTASAAKGTLYLRSDGSGVNDRAYINTNGSTTWTPIVTVG